eukprot:TRINITY_DN4954_c0_g1_i1.p1 TRINITY_DN4954_c0_g1~~TRINITY_DN4954_c0_g1_i1.p1  ORF type:complete len:457 (+),score=96.72 TRINITY_DN4954_c0_g1_i1:114-1373(+)
MNNEDQLRVSSCYLKLLSLIFKSFEIAPSLASVSLVLLSAVLERIDNIAVLVSLLRSNDAFPVLVQILHNLLNSKNVVAPGSEDAIMNVMLVLSQHLSSSTELLCATKLNEVLFNFVPSGVKEDSIFNQVLGGLEMYSSIDGERIVYHKTWCKILHLITSLLMITRRTHLALDLVNNAINFVHFYQERIISLLSLDLDYLQINPNPKIKWLSQAGVEEVEAITGLLYQLSFYVKEWRLINSNAVDFLRSKLIHLCAQYSIILLRPTQFAAQLRPISKEEKQSNDTLKKINGMLLAIVANAMSFVATKEVIERPHGRAEVVDELNTLLFCGTNLSTLVLDTSENKMIELIAERLFQIYLHHLSLFTPPPGRVMSADISEICSRVEELVSQLQFSKINIQQSLSFKTAGLQLLKSLLKRPS